VKIKLIDLINSREILIKLASSRLEDGLTSLKLARNTKNINAELKIFDDVRNNLLLKYGEKKENGMVEVSAFNAEEYNKQMKEILEQEIDIDILLLNPEKTPGFSAMELLPIEWIFEIGKET
jgi:hypothetical protein